MLFICRSFPLFRNSVHTRMDHASSQLNVSELEIKLQSSMNKSPIKRGTVQVGFPSVGCDMGHYELPRTIYEPLKMMKKEV